MLAKSAPISGRDFLLGLVVIVIWAGHAIVIKIITNELEPFTALSMRLIFASIIFLPFLRWPGRENFMQMCKISITMAIMHWGSLFWAMDLLDASIAAILLQTQVIFAILWGMLLFGEKVGWRTAIGAMIGILGVVVLIGVPENPPSIAGTFGIIFSVIAVSLSYAMMKGLKDGVSPLNYIALTHIISLPFMCAFTLVMEDPLTFDWQGVNIEPLIPAFIYQVFFVSISHVMWQRLLTRNDVSVLPNLVLLMPLFSVIFAMIILDENLTITMIAGGLITSVGVGIVMLRNTQKALKKKDISQTPLYLTYFTAIFKKMHDVK